MWLRIVLNEEHKITEQEILDDEFAEQSANVIRESAPDYWSNNKTYKIFYHFNVGHTIFIELFPV